MTEQLSLAQNPSVEFSETDPPAFDNAGENRDSMGKSKRLVGAAMVRQPPKSRSPQRAQSRPGRASDDQEDWYPQLS
jgi:hypothetical protein